MTDPTDCTCPECLALYGPSHPIPVNMTDFHESPCGMCGSPPGVVCEHDDDVVRAEAKRFSSHADAARHAIEHGSATVVREDGSTRVHISVPPADVKREPCGNDDCDKCNPQPWFRISTERVERRRHEREIKAATPEEALRIYAQGTAWPSDYDDRTLGVLEKHEPVVGRIEHTQDEYTCWHDLPAQPTPLTQEQVDALCSSDDEPIYPDLREYHAVLSALLARLNKEWSTPEQQAVMWRAERLLRGEQ